MTIAKQIHVAEQAPEEIVEAINANLRDYNARENAEFWKVATDPANAERPIVVYATDSDGQFLGGLVGETFLKWLKIERIAVIETHRQRGIGNRLIRAAEEEAITRRCQYAFLDTMQYQAPVFYEKLGYAQAGMIPDWDSHGHAKLYFTKTLK